MCERIVSRLGQIKKRERECGQRTHLAYQAACQATEDKGGVNTMNDDEVEMEDGTVIESDDDRNGDEDAEDGSENAEDDQEDQDDDEEDEDDDDDDEEEDEE